MIKKYKLKKSTIKIIGKHISEDEATLINSKLNALKNTAVTITNTGVVSSGKSSLFNALLDYKSGERFSVGAARTTVAEDIEKLTEGIELVDTPGIDVKLEDDEKAINAICSSAIIIMVHNIKMGMLHNNEVEWLKKIVLNFRNTDEIKDRFVFVCSWSDTRMADNSHENTVNETKRILFETIGTGVDCYSVSAKLYEQGVKEKQKIFIDNSGIPELREALIAKADNFNKKYGIAAIKRDAADMCQNNMDKLESVNDEFMSGYNEKKDFVTSKYDLKRREWETVYKKFSALLKDYNKINENISSLY